MKNIWLLFRKEFLQAVRDRRTALLVVIFPLIFYPMVMGTIYHYSSRGIERTQNRPSTVLFSGRDLSPSLAEKMINNEKISPVFYSEKEEGLDDFKAGKGDLLLSLKKQGDSGLSINLKYENMDRDSELALSRTRTVLESFVRDEMKQKVSQLGVNYEDITPPFQINVERGCFPISSCWR